MKTTTTMAIGLALALSWAASADDKKPLDKLQGTWTPVSYEIGGTKLEGDALKAALESLTIKGDAFAWKAGDSNDKGSLQIDASKNPKEIDFVSELEGGVKITSWSGIYALDGDTLKFCIGPGTNQRPKEITNKSLTHGVFTLKKAK